MHLRRLVPSDACAFRALRQRCLAEERHAFTLTPDEEAALPLAHTEARLAKDRVTGGVIGAFDADGSLVAIVGVERETRAKRAHAALIRSVYVAPEARGHRLGERIVGAALAFAASMPGVECVTLGVVETNRTAARLYERLGFAVIGREPDYLRVDGQSLAHLLLMRPLP
ncbi:MAG: GNAT family N-acetyltransferase [Rhodothermales bacterium]|nr:GNAT family N-acetyltransferase [Rhodothermales bacterium]